MPEYKLIYFNAKGLAELCRYMFAYADVAYQDVRFANREEFQEKWKAIKSFNLLPTGKAPVLEIDGKMYSESGAMAKYLAREFGLYGKTNIEGLRIDGIFDMCTSDVRAALFPIFREQDAAKKEELKKKAVETDIPAVLACLEKVADGDYFVGDKLTFADVAFFRTMEFVAPYASNLLDKYPKLKKINDNVAKEPKIAAWIAKRPETEN